jgi:dolichol-phosphate mannosyltransferase
MDTLQPAAETANHASSQTEHAAPQNAAPWPEVSVVVPVKNEQDNILPLVEEIHAAFASVCPFEIVYVDDGSDDQTPQVLENTKETYPMLQIVRHAKSCGQSQAVATGVKFARGAVICTIDGDGQNDPVDLPTMVATLKEAENMDLRLVAGHRHKRKDTRIKKVSSKLANGIRRRLLKDDTPDTGCGMKVLTRAAFLDLPRFNHMHRYLPALMIRRGGHVVSVKVNHRARERGVSKYGTLDRLAVSIYDLIGVIWLMKRASVPIIEKKPEQ